MAHTFGDTTEVGRGKTGIGLQHGESVIGRHMEEAFVVAVHTAGLQVQGQRVTNLFAVLTKSPERAVEIVRTQRQPGDEVTYTGGKLSAETALALDLLPDQAHHL